MVETEYYLYYLEKLNDSYRKKKLLEKPNLYIISLYIITDSKYLYHIMENKRDKWIIINDNNCIKLETNLRMLYRESILFKVSFNDIIFKIQEKNNKIVMKGKIFENVIDKYLHDMFFTIYRKND